MTKLGVCSMTIEPHVFEVALFAVKNPPSALPAVANQSHGQLPPPVVPVPPMVPSTLRIQPVPPSGASGALSPSSNPFAAPPRLAPSQPPGQQDHESDDMRELPAQEARSQNAIPVEPSPRSRAVPAEQAPSRRESGSSTDPVIQMLAARAASNLQLKSLMKIVAQGNASPTELKDFQAHINELNSIIKAQGPQPHKPPAASPFQAQNAASSNMDWSRPANGGPRPIQPVRPSNPPIKQEPLADYQTPPPPSYTKQPKVPGLPKAGITAVAFDVSGGSGDRYLLPKNSFANWRAGNTQVTLSFLVTRKGSEARGGKYKADQEYYQRVSMRLSTQQSKVLEPVGRVMARPDEVQKHMDEVMARATSANSVYLATRLPRSAEDAEHVAVQKIGDGRRDVADLPMDTHEAPSSLLPLRSAINSQQ